jgi:LysM repeat protein
MYRKTMVIENELLAHAKRYGVDPRTARAVVLQESGGNANLVSSAGAQGYFQVMPRTLRSLGVRNNIEAGIKYLAQLHRQFGREDYAIAAYNAGPGTITKGRPLRVETLQYVIGVGHYKSVLRQYEPEIRRQAEAIALRRVRKGDTWESLARTTGIPVAFLYLYNPFLTNRPLRIGALIAHPTTPPLDILEYDGSHAHYTSRIGDSYLNVAHVFRVDLDAFRRENDLWRLQQLPVGLRLRIPVSLNSPLRPFLQSVSHASSRTATPTKRKRQNATPGAKKSAVRTHIVHPGETLTQIARRYQTTVRALMSANRLGNTHIRAGTVLSIPSS